MTHRLLTLVVHCFWLVLTQLEAAAAPMPVEIILSNLSVDAEGDKNVFATPMAYQNGLLFTVHVEPPTGTGRDGSNLQTVIRKGTRQPDATWTWESKVIETRTLRDAWHTQASIAVDKAGYVHVAYNMHNMPWQYVVSDQPLTISSFSFKGQPITQEQIDTVRFENKTNFPDVGSAVIAGNQVTYPMFFKDRNDDLYVSYRFALRPARDWLSRAYSAGIAKYNTATGQWKSIGAPVTLKAADVRLGGGSTSVSTPVFASQDRYTVYLPTLGFDSSNGMHIVWNWRPDEAGMDTYKPSYAYSSDGVNFSDLYNSPVNLPANFANSPSILGSADTRAYYAQKSVALTPEGNPIAILQTVTQGREIWILNRFTGKVTIEPSPFGATEIVVDRQGRQWAFASGIRVFMRGKLASTWEEVGTIGNNLCYPKIQYIEVESRFVVHAKSCDGKHANIYTFRR